MKQPAYAARIDMGRILEVEKNLPPVALWPQQFLNVLEVPSLENGADLSFGPNLADFRCLLGTQSKFHALARTLGTIPTIRVETRPAA